MGSLRRFLLNGLLGCGLLLPLMGRAAAVEPTPSSPAQDAPRRFERAVPRGFEDLIKVERRTAPVVFEGALVGAADITIDLANVRFADPRAVAALIPDLTDPEAVASALTGALPLRSDLACGDAPRANCGRLAPEVAGIIYDRVTGEVLVFVNPQLRRFTAQLARLRPTGVAPALLAGGSLFLSGDAGRGGDLRYTLNLNAVAGAGHRHAILRGSFSDAREALDVAALRSVRDGRDLRLGLFEGAVSTFRATERLVGVRWGATLDDLADAAGAYDTPLVVQLTAPARIEAFAGDRLIGSARYPAGSVTIDTSDFPTGAYPVRLRIDEAGVVREEERFFSRETSFPPIGAPQSFLAIGMRRSAAGFDLGEDDLGAELQLGHRRRLTGVLAGGGALYVREESAAAEAVVAASRAGLDLRASGIWSTRDEAALALSLRATPGPWRVTADVRRALIGASAEAGASAPRDSRRHLVFSEPSWQTSLSISRRLGVANMNLFGSWRDGARTGESWSAQPSLDWPIAFAGGRANLRLSGSFSDTSEQVRFDVTFQRAPWRGASASVRAGYRSLDNAGGVAEAGLQQSLRLGGGARGAVSMRYRRDGDTNEATATGRLQGPLGSASLDATADLARGGGSFFGTSEAGFALSRAGLAFGASARPEAAVVFVNRSAAAEATAQGLVGGARAARIPAGGRRMHAVRAFGSTTAAMLPAAGAALASTSRPQLAQLFPGTVAIVEAEFVDVVAAFGRLVDETGAPIEGAWLETELGQDRTDADGQFLLDVAGRAEVSARRPDGGTCRIVIDAATARSAPVLPLGDVACRR